MADYFAVLQRTLSGFSDPKPELRVKLYDRARSTIERQLASRNPPVTGEDLTLEMGRLEKAIDDIESQYSSPTGNPQTDTQPEPAPVVEDTAAPEVSPVEEAVPEPEPSVQETEENLAPPPIPVFDPPKPERTVEPEPEPEPVPDLAIEIPTIPLTIAESPATDESSAAPEKKSASSSEKEESSNETADDTVDQWAKEFLSREPAQEPAPQPALSSKTSESGSHLVPQAPEPETSEPQSSAKAIPLSHELPAFDPASDTSLGIPPAPGFSPKSSGRSKKRSGLRLIIFIILLGGIAAAGYFGWQSRTSLIDKFGLAGWFIDSQNPQTPKKVKTITIKPEPAEPDTKEPATPAKPTAADKPFAPAKPVAPDKPKAETRIPVDKTEKKPEPPKVAPPVSQSAVLYEEGATAADSSIDKGRVVWSVVQQAPLEGLPAEPTIQGRVEVPSRKLMLTMTIKRNADKSLPASHVIELNFSVPEDFSGGAIGQIRSLVFKSSEQGQGKALIGVPVQIVDGQFILALNNLESAQTTNVGLIKDSGWIDVPMLYRTGRRAFITIEKGVPGEKIFKEVFAAWGQ